jgi:hypothetical protein
MSHSRARPLAHSATHRDTPMYRCAFALCTCRCAAAVHLPLHLPLPAQCEELGLSLADAVAAADEVEAVTEEEEEAMVHVEATPMDEEEGVDTAALLLQVVEQLGKQHVTARITDIFKAWDVRDTQPRSNPSLRAPRPPLFPLRSICWMVAADTCVRGLHPMLLDCHRRSQSLSSQP